MGMEGPGEPPRLENKESVYEALLKSIYSNGIENEETQTLLDIWNDKVVKAVEDSGGSPEQKAKIEIQRTDLYIAAGDMEGARLALTDAFTIATFDGAETLIDEIKERSKTLDMASMWEEFEARRDIALDEKRKKDNE